MIDETSKRRQTGRFFLLSEADSKSHLILRQPLEWSGGAITR